LTTIRCTGSAWRFAESVINAIKHGNALNESKRVHVEEFTPIDTDTPPGPSVRIVRDEGAGFDPETLPDPLRRTISSNRAAAASSSFAVSWIMSISGRRQKVAWKW
jgi:hypothetical protein